MRKIVLSQEIKLPFCCAAEALDLYPKRWNYFPLNGPQLSPEELSG
jgi:hypothetical protein